VAEQMRLGHRYRNALIEIERTRRAAVREILDRSIDPTAQERLDALIRAR